jgi:predicted nucleotidyltransferase
VDKRIFISMERHFNISAARRNLALVTRKRRDELHIRYLKAREDFGAITRMISAKYRPGRIWQWGSLLDERAFSERSDIDIGIEGVQGAETFFALYGDAMALTDFPLDIVQMEKIEPEFAQIIRSKELVVYERP